MSISKEDFAAMISGFEYPARELSGYAAQAKENDLLFIYGMSDDLVELSGMYEDELAAWDGTEFRLGTKGVNVQVIWAPADKPDTSWVILPDCPHAVFEIMEDGEVFCFGAVVHKDDLEAASEPAPVSGEEADRLRARIAERDAEIAELKAHRARTAVKNLRLNNRIAELEAQVRTAGAEALEKAVERFEPFLGDGFSFDDLLEEARRLRGEEG